MAQGGELPVANTNGFDYREVAFQFTETLTERDYDFPDAWLAVTGKVGSRTLFTGAKASAKIPTQCSTLGQTFRLKLTLTRFSGLRPSSHRMSCLM